MTDSVNLKSAWVKTGGVAGLIGGAMYFMAAFVPLPDLATYIAAFGFGPLLAIGAVGVYHCLALERDSISLQIAVASAVIGAAIVLTMLTVQQSIFGVLGDIKSSAGADASGENLKMIAHALNSIHWGMDVAWDILIAIATMLFGVAMLRHPKFGMIFGVSGIISGALVLSFNLYYFPQPPITVDSIDWGPLAALWFLAVFIKLLLNVTWARGKVS